MKAYNVVASNRGLPDSLSHEAVRVLGSEGGEQRAGRQTLFQFY